MFQPRKKAMHILYNTPLQTTKYDRKGKVLAALFQFYKAFTALFCVQMDTFIDLTAFNAAQIPIPLKHHLKLDFNTCRTQTYLAKLYYCRNINQTKNLQVP